ncbi:MAG: Mur ligase domain-containing protein [Patescibacteria group bacterium]
MAPKKAHFIGIGGVGMSAVAKLLKDSGAVVTGSDSHVYPPISNMLEENGLIYHSTYSAQNIPADADVIVIGKSATLRPETNTEVAGAIASGKKILSFPDVLAELSANKETIVLAGSYGKSTCAALLAHCLEHAGKDPSYFIGASPITPSSSARMGKGSLFVMEGDEYPTSNTDSRAKFLLMHPQHVLVTPLAHDHLNVFATPTDYLKPFYELAKLPQTMVVCSDGPLSKEFIVNIPQCTTYSFGDAKNIVWGETTTFEYNGIQLQTTLLGEHNIQNIIGVAALVFKLNLLMPEEFAAGVATFKGVRRRLDKKSDATSILVYEGFGSSYEKLQSAIAAMKLHFPTRPLRVIFEPHTFSWRNRESLPWYDTAFAGAEKVYVYEPPQDGKDMQLSLEEITTRINAAGITAKGAHAAEELLELLKDDLQKDDCILLSSSGAMGGLVESVPALAEQLFPA